MIKLSVNETKWSSFLARTRALTLFISTWIFDFGPEKLPGLSRNGPQGTKMAAVGAQHLENVTKETLTKIHTDQSLANQRFQEKDALRPDWRLVLVH